MDLVTALGAVESLADIPAVIAALGHEPMWEEMPAARWFSGARWHADIRRLALVGRVGRWHWYALESVDAERTVERAARWMGRRGRHGGLIAWDPAHRSIAVSVSADRPPSLGVPLDAPDRFALATMRRAAAMPRPGPLEQSLHVADVLANRRVDRAFFEAFRRSRDRLADAIHGPGAAERDELALLQLTRILFLYFVQAKGWLDGRDDFLARSLDECLRRGHRPQHHLLHPLFFGTLNRPIAERSTSTRRFGRIPFLNGGLFEPHPSEHRWRAVIPSPVWRQTFDELFERFHFTVGEDDSAGIAPDMLGRVFEGLMAPEARRASGTFYTPPKLVARMVDAGLAAVIQTRLDVTRPRAFELLADPDGPARQLLRGVTILDPAAGSGAFLLGALERLTSAAVRDRPDIHQGAALTGARRAALRHNLFGVDVSGTAVRLAELRLWLAVVRDDPAGPGDLVEPLPNLDCTIRQGDSLRDPLPRASSPTVDAASLRAARTAALSASGPDKHAATAALRTAERSTAAAIMAATEAELDRSVTECLSDARSPTLFEPQRGLDRELRARLATLRAERAVARDARRRLHRRGELPWFHYQAHFGDVFARGGFDLVVGNPPWVRAEALPPRVRQQLTRRYRWWGGAGGPGFAHQGDLSIAFLERALELAAPGGAVSLLLPAKLATAAYAARARTALTTRFAVRVVADLGRDADAAFDASAYPLALVVTKERASDADQVLTSLAPTGRGAPASSLAATGPWVITGARVDQILRAIRLRSGSFKNHAPPQLGVKTGDNRVFLDPPDRIAPEYVRVALRGREIDPFRIRPEHRLLWTHDADGRPLAALPASVAEFLRPHRARLEQRVDRRSGPWWQLFRVRPALARYRVVWPDLARQLTAAALLEAPSVIPLNSCYVVTGGTAEKALALTAWLNAAPIRVIAVLGADAAMNGFSRFNARCVGRLPWPDAATADPTLIRLAERGSHGEDTTAALNARVADLLGLDARDQRALLAAGADHRR
ncbi:MAG: Eco57I restriction-modification methylase domain-containing protein [Gemmatimonadales bacterium]